MRFDDHQAAARNATWRLLLLFALNVVMTVLGVNVLLALAWWATTIGLFGGHFPHLFFETNTAIVLFFVLGGWGLESWQLRSGGVSYVAQWLGAREIAEVVTHQRDQRLRNIVQEMAIASAMPVPRAFVLDQEDIINAFALGWDYEQTAVIVTKGALERLTRDELQGVIAHEFGHLQAGDTRLNMRLIGMVFGLQMVYAMGESLWTADAQGRRGAWALVGLSLMGAGWIGWFSGRLLKAAVSRQREFLADAYAAQYTRYPNGLAGALRKLMTQNQEGLQMRHPHTEYVSHVLFWSNKGGAWLATHPPLQERIRRLTGRILTPLPAQILPQAADESVDVEGSSMPAAALVAVAATAAPLCAFASPAPEAAVKAAVEAAATHAFSANASPASVRVDVSSWLPPGEVRATVLAFFVPFDKQGDSEALHTWRLCTKEVQKANRILETVWTLSPKQHPVDFENVLVRAAQLPAPYKALTLEQVAALVKADQRLTLYEYCQLRFAQAYLKGVSSSTHARWSLNDVDEAIEVISVALIMIGGGDPRAALAQVLSVVQRPIPKSLPTPTVQTLDDACLKLRGLAVLKKPMVVKQWAALVCAVQSVDSVHVQRQATALRWLCFLIDSPLPSSLEAFFEA